MAQRCAQLEHVVSNKAGASESSHNTMQELSLLHQMPDIAPKLSSFLRHLPRSASLESGSHGINQSKMLTNFLTLSHVNKRETGARTLAIKII